MSFKSILIMILGDFFVFLQTDPVCLENGQYAAGYHNYNIM